MPKRTAIDKLVMHTKHIYALHELIESKKEDLTIMISLYEKEWPELLHKALTKKNLVICTKCYETVAKSKIKHVFCDGHRNIYSRHKDPEHSQEYFIEEHNLCPQCYQKIKRKYESIEALIFSMEETPMLSSWPNRRQFLIYPDSSQIEIKNKRLEIPENILEALAKKYGIPSRNPFPVKEEEIAIHG